MDRGRDVHRLVPGAHEEAHGRLRFLQIVQIELRTRRFAGEQATDADNNAKLLETLDGLPPERRGAQYVCVLALARPGGTVETVRGTCRGRIATAARGSGGFGYDPIFEPESEPPGDAGRAFPAPDCEEAP